MGCEKPPVLANPVASGCNHINYTRSKIHIMRLIRTIFFLGFFALLAACQNAPAAKNVPAKPAYASAAIPDLKESWMRTELYCGLAPIEAEGLGLAAAEGTWRNFLDEEVTPRFPEGLSVVDAYRQSREDSSGPIVRERSKVLVIVYADTPARRAGITAICEAYKKRTGEKNVLVITSPVTAEVR